MMWGRGSGQGHRAVDYRFELGHMESRVKLYGPW